MNTRLKVANRCFTILSVSVHARFMHRTHVSTSHKRIKEIDRFMMLVSSARYIFSFLFYCQMWEGHNMLRKTDKEIVKEERKTGKGYLSQTEAYP